MSRLSEAIANTYLIKYSDSAVFSQFCAANCSRLLTSSATAYQDKIWSLAGLSLGDAWGFALAIGIASNDFTKILRLYLMAQSEQKYLNLQIKYIYYK